MSNEEIDDDIKMDSTFIQSGVIKYPYPDGNTNHDKFTVTKSNRLIEAQTLLTSREQKILAACISLINPLGVYPNGITVELEDAHIEALTGIDKRHIYRFIDEAAKKFHSIPIETPGKREGTISYINIAHKSEYDPDERKLVIQFHEDMEDELVQLSQYTSVELRYLVRLSSKYAIRLYEILSKQFDKRKGGTQFFKVRLEGLYFPLGLKDSKGKLLSPSYLRNYTTFRTKVLDPACKDISEMSNFEVSFSPFKKGRSVVGVTFTIKQKSKKIENNPAPFDLLSLPNQPDQLDILSACQFIEIKPEILKKWSSLYSEKTIKANLFYCLCRIQEGLEVKKPAAYMTHLLKGDIANLPDIANPYSIKYKSNTDGFEFVKRVVLPIWWKLSEDLRVELVAAGSFSLHPKTEKLYKAFVSLSKRESYDEAEVLYDSDYALEEWT